MTTPSVEVGTHRLGTSLAQRPIVTPRSLLVPLLALCSTAVLGGCVATMAEPDLCADAQAHVRSCGGLEDGDVFVAPSCDPEAAEAILSQPCEALAGPGKADFFGRFLCRLGVLRYCAVPVCTTPGEFEPDATSEGAGSCAELIELESCGQCDYYRCREARSATRCGEDGYFLGFGQRYCERFQQVTEDRLSIAGEAWSVRVRSCLMHSLEDAETDALSCGELRQFAFDSHPACYVETGFCALPVSDWILVLNTIDAADFDLRQMLMAGVGCLTSAGEPGGELDSGH